MQRIVDDEERRYCRSFFWSVFILSMEVLIVPLFNIAAFQILFKCALIFFKYLIAMFAVSNET